MNEKLKILFEKYNFDYIFISTKDIDKLKWNPDPVIDSVDPERLDIAK